MHIRLASVVEADAITALMRRSKAYWGYDAAFMEAALPYLAVPADAIEQRLVWVLEDDSVLAGFVFLKPMAEPGEVLLSDLFVDPPYIGKGCGRLLWDHAV